MTKVLSPQKAVQKLQKIENNYMLFSFVDFPDVKLIYGRSKKLWQWCHGYEPGKWHDSEFFATRKEAQASLKKQGLVSNFRMKLNTENNSFCFPNQANVYIMVSGRAGRWECNIMPKGSEGEKLSQILKGWPELIYVFPSRTKLFESLFAFVFSQPNPKDWEWLVAEQEAD